MTRKAGCSLTLALLTVACVPDAGGPVEPPGSPARARDYIEEVVGLMQTHSVRRLEIDWEAFRDSVFSTAAEARTIEETYPAIRVALKLLGDGHTSFRAVTGDVIFERTRACVAFVPRALPELPAGIGYVRIPGFGGTPDEATGFAQAIQEAIRLQDREDMGGWIVDLRGNPGGNMWPMIAGVGPILGEGTAGYFIHPDGTERIWGYRAGIAQLDDAAAQNVSEPYRLKRESPRVAVLTDGRVASSGEAVAIAFKKRPETRFFGSATCGLSTANQGFAMSDGAALVLTVALMADRTGQTYGNQVLPDEYDGDANGVVLRAAEWLQSPN